MTEEVSPVRQLRSETPKSCEPDTHELIDTDWDTAPQEISFLSACLEFFGPVGRNRDKLFVLLDSGVDETWFINKSRRYLFLGLFSAALQIDAPGVTVRLGAVIDDAEGLSGEKGWAAKEIGRITSKVGLFNLQEFLELDLPLWWNKLKKPRLQKVIGKMDMLLSHLPPTLERLSEIDRLAVNAIDIWRADPISGMSTSDNEYLESIRDECLKPIPEDDYTIPVFINAIDDVLNGGISGLKSPDAGRLVIVCARPGAGKTLVSMNIAASIASKGWKVGFWSFEMSREELGIRLLAAKDFFHCRANYRSDAITYRQLKNRSFTDAQRDRLRSEEYENLSPNLKIFPGNSGMTAEYICNYMKTFAKKHPDTRLFMVDHLGLLNMPGSNRAIAIGEATRQIKTTATELGIDIILLCQLNRGVEMRDDKRPTLSDLRDSGRIEEDADVVLGLYRPGYYDPDDPSLANILEVLALKNRQGRSGHSVQCSVYLDSCAIIDPGSSEALF